MGWNSPRKHVVTVCHRWTSGGWAAGSMCMFRKKDIWGWQAILRVLTSVLAGVSMFAWRPNCETLTKTLLLPLHLFLPPSVCAVVHKDGKNLRPYVFTIHSQHLSSHPVQTLDVAADSLEDLTSWVSKIREATQNADARVSKTSNVLYIKTDAN